MFLSHLDSLILGEVGKLFADAGVICIASLISPYRRDRDACRALLPDGNFIEVGVSCFIFLFPDNGILFAADGLTIIHVKGFHECAIGCV